MSRKNNKRPCSEFDVQSQKSGTHSVEQMQIEDSQAEGASSIPKELSISMIESIIEEEEAKYRTSVLEKETDYQETLYEAQRRGLEELMKCQTSDTMRNWLKQEFVKINEYVEHLRHDYDTIRDRQISHELKLLKINKQDEEIAHLLKEIKQKEDQNAKREDEKAEKVALLEKIKKQKEEVKADIVLHKNRIQNQREEKKKFNELSAKFQEKEQEKLRAEKRVEELGNKIQLIDLSKKAKIEKHEAEMIDVKLRIEKRKMEITSIKKKLDELKEMQELIKNMEQQLSIESRDRLKRQAEQKEQLQKAKLKLQNLGEVFDVEELKFEELCKAKDIKFFSFKELEVPEIQKNLANLQIVINDKEIELNNAQKNLERLQKNREEEIQTKREKLQEAKLFLQAEKLKFEEQRKISEKLKQKISDVNKRIQEQDQEKQEILNRMEIALARKKELKDKIEEWKLKIVEKEKETLMVEDMNKDALDVNKHLIEALKNNEALEVEIAEYKKEHHAKFSEIENRIAAKSKVQEKKISELESELEQYTKTLSQKKREGKRREEEKMQKERNLREKLSKLEEEIAKVDEDPEVDSTLTQANPQPNLKSILKSPKYTISQPKSPKAVKFDIESEDSGSGP